MKTLLWRLYAGDSLNRIHGRSPGKGDAMQGQDTRSEVALVRCQDYDESRVFDAVGRGLSLLGGPERFVKRAEQILLKVNLLVGSAPAKAVTTHPSVFEAVARHFQGAGADITYGDSPGFGSPGGAARRAGLSKVAQELGMPLADFNTGETVSFPEGHLVKQFTIAKGVLDADGLISLPKLKTHALTRMTGAVKNQFGCIPGLYKGEFHARLRELDRFAQMLVDLDRFIRPRLYIMDAVVAMEGNGPRSGAPRPMSALLLSNDPVALDATACRMMNLDPVSVPTIKWGEETGHGTYTRVDVLGDPLEAFVASDYKADRKKASPTGSMNGVLAGFLRQLIVPRPVIDASLCTKCGTCVEVCPAKPEALGFRQGDESVPPSYDYSACIRCFCCQELCPEKAITVDTPLLGRLLHR